MVRFVPKENQLPSRRPSLLKRILYFFLLIPFMIPASARAQADPGFSSMEIDLWPEYDRPDMLVIYKGVLSPEVTLPAKLTFRIPVEAGEPTAVAAGTDSASVADVIHTSTVNGDWLEVSFIAAMPAIQLEYYDPSLVIEGNQRIYQYTWPGDYAVDALTLQVQHPVGTTDMTITPSPGRVEQGGDGFTYNIIDLGSLVPASTFSLDINYQKEGNDLSFQTLEIQPSAPITPQSTSGLTLNKVWPWLLGLLGILLIAGGGFWYWRSGRETTTPKPERRRRAAASRPPENTAPDGVYCHQCGKRASPGDRFCRACGTRLRIE
jgi:hypothetical protein